MGPLATNREAPAVADPPIASDFDQAFDVHGDLLAEVTLDPTFVLEDALDAKDLVFGQILDFGPLLDLGDRQDIFALERPMP